MTFSCWSAVKQQLTHTLGVEVHNPLPFLFAAAVSPIFRAMAMWAVSTTTRKWACLFTFVQCSALRTVDLRQFHSWPAHSVQNKTTVCHVGHYVGRLTCLYLMTLCFRLPTGHFSPNCIFVTECATIGLIVLMCCELHCFTRHLGLLLPLLFVEVVALLKGKTVGIHLCQRPHLTLKKNRNFVKLPVNVVSWSLFTMQLRHVN